MVEVANRKLCSKYFHAARSKALRQGAAPGVASEAGRQADRRVTRLTRGIAGVCCGAKEIGAWAELT